MEELLSIKLRPNKLSEVIGQKHLIGKDKVISNLVKNKKLFSMIYMVLLGLVKLLLLMLLLMN